MGLELHRDDLQVLLFCISPLLLRLHKEHFQPSVCTSNDTKITELGLRDEENIENCSVMGGSTLSCFVITCLRQ
jgi:hypothetical protein